MRQIAGRILRRFFSERTLFYLRMDWWRFQARMSHFFQKRRNLTPREPRLHLGCGSRRVSGWLNVDLGNSDYKLDLARIPMPWCDGAFEAVVSQHVIEHLDLNLELRPLLGELFRMSKPGGEVWLSCPSMSKVCEGYVKDKGEVLYRDAQTRGGIHLPDGMPVQHYINDIFHQDGSHKNLYDFELMKFALEEAGFGNCREVAEKDLLARFPGFPERRDDVQSLYITASRDSGSNGDGKGEAS